MGQIKNIKLHIVTDIKVNGSKMGGGTHGHLALVATLLLTTCGCHNMVFDMDELSVQYGIEISNKPVLANSHAPEENVVQLSSKHGQTYSCFLPPPVAPHDEDADAAGAGSTQGVADILDASFNGTCLTYKKGWWTYKMCHKKSITQYHVNQLGEVSGVATLLGEFESEDDWTTDEVKERKPSELFHSHKHSRGDVCDVTGKPRGSTVQYFCDTKSKDAIIRIEEPSTCAYIITVVSNKLCTHPL